MTKEEILDQNVSCTCDVGYKSRGLSDPNCPRHSFEGEIISAMEQYSASQQGGMRDSFLKELRRLSVERAKHGFKTYDNQPITYWTTAVIGEFGELCNMIKKMKRAENGGHDSGHSYTAKSITPKMLREEVGGTLIYIDLLCSFLNIDLQEAVTETFNEKSIELKFPYLLSESPAEEGQDEKLWDEMNQMFTIGMMTRRGINELFEEAKSKYTISKK